MSNSKHYQKIFKKPASGFTLIEVLVASVILFSSIATVSMIYRGAFMSSEKANTHITINGVLPSILSSIRHEVRSQANSEQTQLSGISSAWEVSYKWQATLQKFNSAPSRLDPNSGQLVTPPPKYKLWEITLDLQYGGITKIYQFNELSWNND